MVKKGARPQKKSRNLRSKSQPQSKALRQLTSVVNNLKRNVPAAIPTRVTRLRPPRMQTSGRVVRIKHREYLTRLLDTTTATASFNQLIYPTSAIFPWLKGQSLMYDRYRFHSITLQYEPAAGTSTNGFVVLAWDPDPQDAVASTTYNSVMSWRKSKRSNVYKPCTLTLNESDLKGSILEKFIPTNVPTGSDLYDKTVGQFKIFTDGMGTTSGVAAGDILVSYDISLIDPQQASIFGSDEVPRPAYVIGNSQLTKIGLTWGDQRNSMAMTSAFSAPYYNMAGGLGYYNGNISQLAFPASWSVPKFFDSNSSTMKVWKTMDDLNDLMGPFGHGFTNAGNAVTKLVNSTNLGLPLSSLAGLVLIDIDGNTTTKANALLNAPVNAENVSVPGLTSAGSMDSFASGIRFSNTTLKPMLIDITFNAVGGPALQTLPCVKVRNTATSSIGLGNIVMHWFGLDVSSDAGTVLTRDVDTYVRTMMAPSSTAANGSFTAPNQTVGPVSGSSCLLLLPPQTQALVHLLEIPPGASWPYASVPNPSQTSVNAPSSYSTPDCQAFLINPAATTTDAAMLWELSLVDASDRMPAFLEMVADNLRSLGEEFKGDPISYLSEIGSPHDFTRPLGHRTGSSSRKIRLFSEDDFQSVSRVQCEDPDAVSSSGKRFSLF